MLLSQFILLSTSPSVSTSPFSVSLLLLADRFISTVFLVSIYICINIQYCFSLSERLTSLSVRYDVCVCVCVCVCIYIYIYIYIYLFIYSTVCIVVQLCLTLCDSMDCSLPVSSVHGILQARILQWVVMPFSRVSSQPRDQTQVSCICRWILYHLSQQGKPKYIYTMEYYSTKKRNKNGSFVAVIAVWMNLESVK